MPAKRIENISNAPNETFLEKVVWCLSNLCRGKQTVEMNNIIPVFPVLIKLLDTSHVETLQNTCWALAYLTEDNETVSQNAGGVCRPVADNGEKQGED